MRARCTFDKKPEGQVSLFHCWRVGVYSTLWLDMYKLFCHGLEYEFFPLRRCKCQKGGLIEWKVRLQEEIEWKFKDQTNKKESSATIICVAFSWWKTLGRREYNESCPSYGGDPSNFDAAGNSVESLSTATIEPWLWTYKVSIIFSCASCSVSLSWNDAMRIASTGKNKGSFFSKQCLISSNSEL